MLKKAHIGIYMVGQYSMDGQTPHMFMQLNTFIKEYIEKVPSPKGGSRTNASHYKNIGCMIRGIKTIPRPQEFYWAATAPSGFEIPGFATVSSLNYFIIKCLYFYTPHERSSGITLCVRLSVRLSVRLCRFVSGR